MRASLEKRAAEAESEEGVPEWLCAAERLLQASMTGETALVAEMGEAANKTIGQEVRRQHSVWRRRAAMAAAKGRARRAAALLQQTWRQHAAKLAQAAYDEREAKDRVEKFFAKAIAEEAWQRAMWRRLMRTWRRPREQWRRLLLRRRLEHNDGRRQKRGLRCVKRRSEPSARPGRLELRRGGQQRRRGRRHRTLNGRHLRIRGRRQQRHPHGRQWHCHLHCRQRHCASRHRRQLICPRRRASFHHGGTRTQRRARCSERGVGECSTRKRRQRQGRRSSPGIGRWLVG